MLYDTPLRKRHEEWASREAARATPAEARRVRVGAAVGRRAGEGVVEYLPWGPTAPDGSRCDVPASFGPVEVEYAALRRGAGLLDAPNRGTLRLTGTDRIEFLGRMVTQDLRRLEAGGTAAAFWLNRQGRIEADLLLVELGDETLVDVDVHQAAATAAGLAGFLFTEDVAIEDASADQHRIGVHGPHAVDLVRAAAADGAALEPARAARVTIAGRSVALARQDVVGAPGVLVFVARADAGAVWDALLAAAKGAPYESFVRPVGWFAFNTARIEAGTPLFNIDFGPTNLPHETGVLDERVSFTKGCYVGQEIVARIQSQGRPRQVLVGLRVHGDGLPPEGAAVATGTPDDIGETVGIVTSSTPSPMLGARPIAFAMLRSAAAEPGATVVVAAEGGPQPAEIVGLRFWAPK